MAERTYLLTDETGKVIPFGNLRQLVNTIANDSKYTTIWRGVQKASAGGFDTPYFSFGKWKIQESNMRRHKKTRRD